MTIRFDCQFCGKTLKADDAKAGMKVKCPSCEGMLTIPELTATEDVEEPEGRSSGEPNRSPAGSSGRKVPCPACDELISPKATVCPSCGEEFDGIKRNRLASPMQRLYGFILDFIAAMIFLGPGILLTMVGLFISGDNPSEPQLLPILGMLGFAVGALVLLVIQVYLLMQRSQSIGKYFAKIQIMDYETDLPAGLVKTFLLRSVVNHLIGRFCPGIYFLVDSLFVFGEEHRCLHDQIAGTYVADISEA